MMIKAISQSGVALPLNPESIRMETGTFGTAAIRSIRVADCFPVDNDNIMMMRMMLLLLLKCQACH